MIGPCESQKDHKTVIGWLVTFKYLKINVLSTGLSALFLSKSQGRDTFAAYRQQGALRFNSRAGKVVLELQSFRDAFVILSL